MVSIENARLTALSLPAVEEKSHFDTPDFRVGNKIFATLHPSKSLAMVKLNLVDQSVFCSFGKEIFYPVPGGWGQNGATFINLKKIKKAMLVDAFTTAWKTVAKPSVLKKYFPEG